MNRILIAVLFFAAVGTAAAADDQKTTVPAPAKTPEKLTIPEGAVNNGNNTWSYTDEQGKHWTYSRSPLGITRAEVKDDARAADIPGLPKGSTKNANGTYSWTGPDGKKWTYRRTPLGLQRSPQAPKSKPE